MRTNETKMTAQDLNVVRNFFSDDEWSAIESSLRDYADYGDDEADIADSVQAKLTQLFSV